MIDYISVACYLLLRPIVQGAVELSDEGAAILSAGLRLLQGPNEPAVTAAECKFADVELILTFWLVRPSPGNVWTLPDAL